MDSYFYYGGNGVMKKVIQIFVATLIVAVIGQSCVQAFNVQAPRQLSNMLNQYVNVQNEARNLEQQANSGQGLEQNQIDKLHAYQSFDAEMKNTLIGGSIGSITNKTSFYYVFGKMNFAANGTQAHLQVYVPGDDGSSSSPADWIVIGPGETVNVNLDLQDLASFGPQGMYGYYGLILYNQNPQGLTASGIPSLYNMVQQNLSGSSMSSPFGQMAPNYKNIYNLAGGNLNIDFGGASNEFCISRTTDLLQRNHCITPNTLLNNFTTAFVMGSSGDSKFPLFASQITMGSGSKNVYWPISWKINLDINPITTNQVAKDGAQSTTTYIMPSISQFIVTGLRPISKSVLAKFNALQYKPLIAMYIEAYNRFVDSYIGGFSAFQFYQFGSNGSATQVNDQHSVNVPVTQVNSYGRLPAISTMRNLEIIASALKSKPSGWSDSLWRLAQHLWSDIPSKMPARYVPIHHQN